MQIDLAALPDDPDVLRRMLREVVPELQAENEKLWQLIQRLLRHRYGPRSEKLDLDQLQLVLEDAEQSAAESDAAKDAAEPTERRRRIEVSNRNRGALPAHLPRYEVVIDIDNRQCPCCGGALHMIGEDRTEQLDLVPAQLRVKVPFPSSIPNDVDGEGFRTPAHHRPATCDGRRPKTFTKADVEKGIVCQPVSPPKSSDETKWRRPRSTPKRPLGRRAANWLLIPNGT